MAVSFEVRPAAGFDVLYRTYRTRVYRQCLRMLRSPEDAEDLTQEVFLLVFRKVNTFRGESSFTTWLHRLTINCVLMQLRRERRRSVTTDCVDPSAAGGNLERRLIEEAPQPLPRSFPDRVSLDDAIAQLSDRYREVFVLHDVEGYGHGEIGRLLGINEGTSKSQLHKARHRLRLLLCESKRDGRTLTMRRHCRTTAKVRKHASCGVHYAAA